MAEDLDPIQYEIFRHRLFNILEEGRIAIAMVSGSPVVVEGGETMCSFYTSDGTPILTAAGILLHCTGARDFILKAIEWYEKDPGINEGDQLFFNDPYIGGQHLPDQIIIKPIFYGGERIAWTGSFMHTPETGGIEPGGMPASAREIFHEGIRILGLKIVERGRFRPEVFKTIVEQVRDPHLVGLDTKAKIAANNVCARSYLKLIEKYGIDFVKAASQRIIDDSEKIARAKLRMLPDGVWRSRLHGDNNGLVEKPFKVVCAMTKMGDEVIFDYTGSSPQTEGSINSTLAATWGGLFVVLASQLFWDVPWNGGMIAPVKLIAPEGSIVNCKFPAACSNGVQTVNCLITETAHECIAKMLFAGGLIDDINSAWRGAVGGGPYFGAMRLNGDVCGGVLLDSFIPGCGATPKRDGVDTGGNMMNPTSSVSDAEVIELNAPVIYLARKNAADSSGLGKYKGGMGPEMVYMVYDAKKMQMGIAGLGRRIPGNWGMFGGYPSAIQESRFILSSDIKEQFKKSKCPLTFQELAGIGGVLIDPPNSYPAIPLKDYDILIKRLGAGGGYGDPLDRDPQIVAEDIKKEAISFDTAAKVYGVVVSEATLKVDVGATSELRLQIREERMKEGKKLRF